jgi:hypothetical protein
VAQLLARQLVPQSAVQSGFPSEKQSVPGSVLQWEPRSVIETAQRWVWRSELRLEMLSATVSVSPSVPQMDVRWGLPSA